MTTNATIGHGAKFAILDTTLSPPAYVDIAEVTNITPFNIARDAVEATHTQSPDRIREFIPGLVDYGEASIDINFVPGSSSDQRIRALFRSREAAQCQITFPTSPEQVLQFAAIITGYSPEAPLDDKLTATATFKISGRPTWVGESP